MATNPNNAIGTNAAYSGRTSPNAFNDVLAMFTRRGILNGWEVLPSNNMVITLGGQNGVRDVAIAEDNAGNKTTVNNISEQPVEVEIQAASTTSASTDYIVAYVNNPPEGQALLADNPGACGLIDVRGSGNLAPTEEQIRAAITADGAGGTTAYYVVLATISIPIAATTITATNITQGAKSHSVDWATQIYGADEQEVGIWTNGKVIYRKVLKFQTQSSNFNTQTFDTGLSGVDEILPMTSSIVHPSGFDILPGYGDNLGYRIEFSTNRTKVSIVKQGVQNWLQNSNLIVVVYYTKTTN